MVAFSALPKYGSNAAASRRLPLIFRPSFSGCAVTSPDTLSAPLRFSVAFSCTGSGFVMSSLIFCTDRSSGLIASFTARGVDRSVKFAAESFTFSASIR
ncbi:hypothetical protein BamIOP4010DRAFT_5843 [Burkholderia ambifaria IOP40-10]|uniref:Uncharacterized protein n=1 Tax=Burkholderia ambifaria IOP40-10 TaxID=396596 RepID=B1FP82_9BURK|nr:hypothetical protein BamIOP4010DRAFT_5843 [Burkholderia ambifaria IOP40-10]